MNYKRLLVQALKLIKAYMASKRGQKRVAGVANLFSGMYDQVETGREEIEQAKTETRDRIDELTAQLDEQVSQSNRAARLMSKLAELAD
jgi:hypothetical protein